MAAPEHEAQGLDTVKGVLRNPLSASRRRLGLWSLEAVLSKSHIDFVNPARRLTIDATYSL